MIETIQKLVQLSKAKDNLPAILIEGLVDDYVSKNGEIKFKDRFCNKLEKPSHEIKYLLYSSRNKIQDWYEKKFEYSWQCDYYGVKWEIEYIKDFELKLFNSNPLSWYKKYRNLKYNGRIIVKYKCQYKNLQYYFTTISQSTLRGFKLETEDYYDRYIGDCGKTIKQAIIYIKYKQSKHNHPLIQIALSQTDRPPKTDCYLYLLKFRIDSVEQGERLLQYLHYFIKDLI